MVIFYPFYLHNSSFAENILNYIFYMFYIFICTRIKHADKVKYNAIYLFYPGVGGNLVAVQASRLSTALHQASRPGVLPEDAVHGCPNLCSTFFGKSKKTEIFLFKNTAMEEIVNLCERKKQK